MRSTGSNLSQNKSKDVSGRENSEADKGELEEGATRVTSSAVTELTDACFVFEFQFLFSIKT